MKVKVIGLTTIYTDRSCLVTVELVETTGVISKVVEKLEVSIPKPYDHICKAVEWEVATLLNDNGYAVFVPDRPENVLPLNQGAIVYPEVTELTPE
jgi:hypothetical protein